MSSMMGTLFTSTSTPLYSTKWTPATTGQYAGTCIFIIILAAIFRGLVSYRAMRERGWRNVELKRRPIIVAGKKQDDEAAGLGEKGIGAGGGKERRSRPWRIIPDVPRALLDTVVAGVGYLLSVVGAPDRKIYMLISLQHVGGDDHERRLLPFCPRWHISGQPNVWTLRGPLCTIATSTADSCHGEGTWTPVAEVTPFRQRCMKSLCRTM